MITGLTELLSSTARSLCDPLNQAHAGAHQSHHGSMLVEVPNISLSDFILVCSKEIIVRKF
jgi:hypothetical protein